MAESLNYNEVMQFMKEFEIDLINRFDELIIDQPTNTFTSIRHCNDINEVKTTVIYSLCRPIGKGLDIESATRLLNRVNKYFNTNLTREDMKIIYNKLCSVSKIDQMSSFIQRGFPMNELKD